MKVLVEIYTTYGKNDNESLADSFLIDDTTEARQSLIEDYQGDYAWGSEKDFIDGTKDEMSYALYGGDWDEPTGRTILITTYEEKLREIQAKFDNDVKNLKQKFNIQE